MGSIGQSSSRACAEYTGRSDEIPGGRLRQIAQIVQSLLRSERHRCEAFIAATFRFHHKYFICNRQNATSFGTRSLLYISHPGHADNGINAAWLHYFNLQFITASYDTKCVEVPPPHVISFY